MKTLYEDVESPAAETSEVLRDATDALSQLEKIDWQFIAGELNEQGSSILKNVLNRETCRALAGLYPHEAGFRSRVIMARHGFGRGEYKYFSYPLPGIVQALRTALYRQLCPVANQWNQAMGIEVRTLWSTPNSLTLPQRRSTASDSTSSPVRCRRLQLSASGSIRRARFSYAGSVPAF